MKKILVLVLFLTLPSLVWADEFRDTPKASADDGQEVRTSGAVNISYTYIELVYALNRWGAAVRFPNLTIPQGATIDGARMKIWSYSGSWDHVYDTLACHDVDSATSIVVSNYNISNRWDAATTAKVLWSDDVYAGAYDSTCDLSSIMQEVVNRPGWKSGNAIMFLFRNRADSSEFEIYSWDYSTSYCESLIVYYTPAEEEAVMRVKDDWRFTTHFMRDWRFQDVEEWGITPKFAKGEILKRLESGEVAHVLGRQYRIEQYQWKQK